MWNDAAVVDSGNAKFAADAEFGRAEMRNRSRATRFVVAAD